jgi:hypothetical protein
MRPIYNSVQEAANCMFHAKAKWGCQKLSSVVSEETMQEEHPDGFLVETIHGFYWIWET